MSENFASLEYKTQEEVLTVTKSLTAVLSTTGMQLVEMFSPSHLLTQLHGPTHLQESFAAPSAPEVAMDIDMGTPQNIQPQSTLPPARNQDMGVIRSSVIVAMVMLVKAHLKGLYGLSEE